MRRRFIIAALGALLAGAPLWAQHGGHGGMSGGHGGFAGGHAGAAPIGRPYGGASFASHPAPVGPGHYPGWNHGGHYPYRPGYGYRPYPGRYPYYWGYPSSIWLGAWSGYYPGFWYDDSGSYDSSYSSAYPPTPAYPVYSESPPPDADVYADQQEEIDRLQQQVTSLRNQQSTLEAQSSARPSASNVTIRGQTVLVFRDRHTEEIQNYAITGKTLWVFNEQRARKIPLAELDLPATTKANEDRGIDFRVPQ